MPNHGMTSVETAEGPAKIAPGAYTALGLLLAVNLFNYLDRQVLAAVEPEIREAFQTTEFWTGWLSTAFLVTYMLVAPVFGRLAERYPRWVLVGFGVLVWSLASGASGVDWGVGLAAGFWLLLLTRCFVGVGEGAYMPVAPAMISDMFPVKQRGQVLSWFFLAIPIGGALGYALGTLCVINLDWRWAFYLVVPPGIILGLVCFLMRDPPRGVADNVAVPSPGEPGQREARKPLSARFAALLREFRSLWAIPSYRFNTMGMTAMSFSIGALAFWMPAFLKNHQVQPMFGIPPQIFFGVLTALAGIVATLVGGLVGDWLRRSIPGSYFIVSGIAFILGFPMVLLFLWVPFPWAWFFVFFGVFVLFFNTGPTNAILANVTHPSERAMGFALNIFIIHAFGDAISPPIIGGIAVLTNPMTNNQGLDIGFVFLAATMLIGGVLWIMGARHLERDTEMAPKRIVVR